MWHVTCGMWHVTGGGRGTFSENFSLLALTTWEGRFVEYLEEKAHWLNQLMNDKGVCRTAPATPGLLKKQLQGFNPNTKLLGHFFNNLFSAWVWILLRKGGGATLYYWVIGFNPSDDAWQASSPDTWLWGKLSLHPATTVSYSPCSKNDIVLLHPA